MGFLIWYFPGSLVCDGNSKVLNLFTEILARLSFALFNVSSATALEIVAAPERQSWASRLRGLKFLMFYVLGTVVAAWLLRQLILTFGPQPLLFVDLRLNNISHNGALAAFSYVMAPCIPILLGDFLYYWFHRLQHIIPLLWRFHAVHHAIEELNAANCNHHTTEEIFKIPFIALPMALLLRFQVPDVAIFSIFLAAQQTFIHANLRFSLGPLNYLIARPLYHRIHHSIDPFHNTKNFGSLSPIWDIVFGTAYFPARDEQITTGLPDRHEAKTVDQYLLALCPKQTVVTVEPTKPVTDSVSNSKPRRQFGSVH
jgi:sterol desaturase/sphingolipid hydroxylase (fatty acid hydroxylase superfamily)